MANVDPKLQAYAVSRISLRLEKRSGDGEARGQELMQRFAELIGQDQYFHADAMYALIASWETCLLSSRR